METMTLNYEDIGVRIRELRKKKKWTQEYLGEVAEVEPSNISHIERAATKVSLPTLVKIANALDTTLDTLVCGSLVRGDAVLPSLFAEVLADCTGDEMVALLAVVKTTKEVLRKA